MRFGGQCAALSSLKIHDVPADRAATQRKRGIIGLCQNGQADPEPAIGFFRARYRLKDEIDRGAEIDGLDGGRDMTQTAGLRRNIEVLPNLVEQGDDPHIVLHAIGRRIDADHRVADPEQKSVEQGWPQFRGNRRSDGSVAAAWRAVRQARSCCGKPS